MMLPILLHKIVFIIIALSLSLLGQFIIGKILNFYQNKIAIKTKTKNDDELTPLVKRLLSILIWASGIWFVLIELGVDVNALYATAGVSSICTVMIVKESIKNIVAGVTIMFDRPFRVGDTVRLATGDSGIVQKIGLRRTYIKIPRGKSEAPCILIIPNKQLSESKVYNFTLVKEQFDDEL